MNIYSWHIPYDNPVRKKEGTQRRPNIALDFQYITIHTTGNPSSSAKGERNWLVNPSNKRTASWHIVIDNKDVIEAIPTGLKELFTDTTKAEVAYHAGNYTGNRKSIGIELCESEDFNKTVINAITIVAKILFIKGWDITRIKQHYDWSGKNCPRLLRVNNKWQEFLDNVQIELNKLKGGKNVMKLKDWEITLGLESIEKLTKNGIISNPDIWQDRLDENMPNWLAFTLLSRIIEKN